MPFLSKGTLLHYLCSSFLWQLNLNSLIVKELSFRSPRDWTDPAPSFGIHGKSVETLDQLLSETLYQQKALQRE